MPVIIALALIAIVALTVLSFAVRCPEASGQSIN